MSSKDVKNLQIRAKTDSNVFGPPSYFDNLETVENKIYKLPTNNLDYIKIKPLSITSKISGYTPFKTRK